MNLPPENVLRGALRVLYISACMTRNWTLNDEVSREQINDLWEAVHDIPDLLTRWAPDAEEQLVGYLDEYDEKWPAPKLRAVYVQALEGDLP